MLTLKKLCFYFLLLVSVGATAQTIDLREYLPHGSSNVLLTKNGNAHSRYTIEDNNSNFVGLYNSLFNQGKPGIVSFLKKDYMINGAWCPVTYAVILKGTDKSVTEVGDWGMTNCTTGKASGYKKLDGTNGGLLWSDAGGMSIDKLTEGEFEIFYQRTSDDAYAPINYQAYTRSGLLEILPTFTPQHDGSNGMWVIAGGQTYTNVVKHVMYHGVKNGSNTVPIRCINAYPSASGEFYQSYKTYNSYAVVLWLAKGVGVVQEKFLYAEDGSYWGMSNCSGYPFNKPYVWAASLQN